MHGAERTFLVVLVPASHFDWFWPVMGIVAIGLVALAIVYSVVRR